jgi:NTP pyrophosphatase (non-canonical NTP hydrolase)
MKRFLVWTKSGRYASKKIDKLPDFSVEGTILQEGDVVYYNNRSYCIKNIGKDFVRLDEVGMLTGIKIIEIKDLPMLSKLTLSSNNQVDSSKKATYVCGGITNMINGLSVGGVIPYEKGTKVIIADTSKPDYTTTVASVFSVDPIDLDTKCLVWSDKAMCYELKKITNERLSKPTTLLNGSLVELESTVYMVKLNKDGFTLESFSDEGALTGMMDVALEPRCVPMRNPEGSEQLEGSPFIKAIERDSDGNRVNVVGYKPQSEVGNILDEKLHVNSYETIISFKRLVDSVHTNAVSKGFWNTSDNIPEKMMLIVSELGEALEALRVNHRISIATFAAKDCIDKTFFKENIKDSFEDEICDVVIRLLDLCGYMDIDLAQHILYKMNYNQSREYLHGKSF